MKTPLLTTLTKTELLKYRDTTYLMKYEAVIFDEILEACNQCEPDKLTWYGGFGDSLRTILMNVYAYRKGTEFGFDKISFDQHGWLERPSFLEKEDLIFGNQSRYGEYSTLHIGRGIAQVWTYALTYSFGTAGSGSSISVYGKQFRNREAAISAGLGELKKMMTEKLGNRDTTNYKQPVIISTLKDIAKAENERIQLTLWTFRGH